MKRVDQILSEPELDPVLQAIDQAGCSGYTVMRHVTGRGPRGAVSDNMEFSGLGANAHVIVFCAPELLEPLRSSLRPLLSYYGGVGFVSDAEPL
jgi:nitrogen regulatory protein PII